MAHFQASWLHGQPGRMGIYAVGSPEVELLRILTSGRKCGILPLDTTVIGGIVSDVWRGQGATGLDPGVDRKSMLVGGRKTNNG